MLIRSNGAILTGILVTDFFTGLFAGIFSEFIASFVSNEFTNYITGSFANDTNEVFHLFRFVYEHNFHLILFFLIPIIALLFWIWKNPNNWLNEYSTHISLTSFLMGAVYFVLAGNLIMDPRTL